MSICTIKMCRGRKCLVCIYGFMKKRYCLLSITYLPSLIILVYYCTLHTTWHGRQTDETLRSLSSSQIIMFPHINTQTFVIFGFYDFKETKRHQLFSCVMAIFLLKLLLGNKTSATDDLSCSLTWLDGFHSFMSALSEDACLAFPHETTCSSF